MNIRQSNKFKAVSMLLFLLFTISFLSFSKTSVKKLDSCKRIEKEKQILLKSFVNTKCQACHTD